MGSESKDGRNCYVLEVTPKRKNKYLYNGKIWVDAKDFAVTHVEARPAVNPSFWISGTDIEHRYEKVGDFWLPQKPLRDQGSHRRPGRADHQLRRLQADSLARTHSFWCPASVLFGRRGRVSYFELPLAFASALRDKTRGSAYSFRSASLAVCIGTVPSLDKRNHVHLL